MNKKLIALAVIAAGALAVDSLEIQPGTTFEAPEPLADDLVAAGQAKLADAQAPAKVKAVKVRLLMDCEHGKANDLVELPAPAAKAAEAAGQADSEKGAVAYAATLPQNRKPEKTDD